MNTKKFKQLLEDIKNIKETPAQEFGNSPSDVAPQRTVHPNEHNRIVKAVTENHMSALSDIHSYTKPQAARYGAEIKEFLNDHSDAPFNDHAKAAQKVYDAFVHNSPLVHETIENKHGDDEDVQASLHIHGSGRTSGRAENDYPNEYGEMTAHPKYEGWKDAIQAEHHSYLMDTTGH